MFQTVVIHIESIIRYPTPTISDVFFGIPKEFNVFPNGVRTASKYTDRAYTAVGNRAENVPFFILSKKLVLPHCSTPDNTEIMLPESVRTPNTTATEIHIT
jgi:hypothetical protein